MTEYWDGTGITAEQVGAEVRKLAAKRPEYVYDPENYPDFNDGNARCKYTHTLGDGETKVPGCIIGQAIFSLTGNPVDQSVHAGGVADLPFMAGVASRHKTGTFLKNVQRNQDMKMSWGEAVSAADDPDDEHNWYRS